MADMTLDLDSRHDQLLQLAQRMQDLTSEQPNPASETLDTLPALDIARLMNAQDKTVPLAVEKELPQIARAIEAAARSLRDGGRIIYVGAGTSGRLGVLDASECVPTFSAAPDQVIAVIAGGKDAVFTAREGAEDDARTGARDLEALDVGPNDTVVGLAASGRTPYVLEALRRANAAGATTVSVTCNTGSEMGREADIDIAPLVGPEILTGSTRLKSGTAQKMVLNMISTGAMVQIGKCFGNRMVDLQATNDKLKARAINLVREIAGLETADALQALEAADWDIKVAILTRLAGVDADRARRLIAENGGHLSRALARTGPQAGDQQAG